MSAQTLPIQWIQHPKAGRVCVLTLEQPGRPVVVIDESLLDQLDGALDTITHEHQDNPMQGFVLASAAERAFVAGADLKAIMAMNDEDLHAYLERGAKVFQRIADLPCPTAAAIHSTALGGGLELAMHCDALVGLIDPDAKPFLIGLPEAGLKICPGWGGTNLLPARIDAQSAIEMTANGIALKSDKAASYGIFDLTVSSRDDLIEAAIGWIDQNPAPSRSGAPSRCITPQNAADMNTALERAKNELESRPHTDAVCDCVKVGIDKGWSDSIQREREHLVKLRHTPPAQEAINAFFNKGK